MTPVVSGNPVQDVSTPADGVPRAGVVNEGELAKTSAPDPVSSVIALAKFALEGVANHVAMPVPNPVTPPMGNVQLVKVPD